MVKLRLTSTIAISFIVVCCIYWLSKAATPSFSTSSKGFQESLRKGLRQNSGTDTSIQYHAVPNHGSSAQEDLIANESEHDEGAAYDTQDDDKASTSVIEDIAIPTAKAGKHLRPDISHPIDSPLLPHGYSAAFPRHVWQTSSIAGKEKYAKQVETWKKVSGFKYNWLSDADADAFVYNAFSQSRPSLVTFWNELSTKIHAEQAEARAAIHKDFSSNTNITSFEEIVVDSTASSSIVLRADLLRYMLMSVHGGVYADIDTSVLFHIDRWIPNDLGSQIINAIIGIEYDDHTMNMFVRPVSFCQWTLMSKPNHPIFTRAIDRVVSNLEFLARHQRVHSLSDLKIVKTDVLEATGPGMISDVVLEVIRDQLPDQNITWSTFHGQKEPKLFGDVLILPINGFAGAQKHSHAGDPEYGEMLVRHHFGRSWYRPAAAKPVTSAKPTKGTET